MKIKFYDITTKKVVYMEFEDVLKGVPIGYYLYGLLARQYQPIIEDEHIQIIKENQ